MKTGYYPTVPVTTPAAMSMVAGPNLKGESRLWPVAKRGMSIGTGGKGEHRRQGGGDPFRYGHGGMVHRNFTMGNGHAIAGVVYAVSRHQNPHTGRLGKNGYLYPEVSAIAMFREPRVMPRSDKEIYTIHPTSQRWKLLQVIAWVLA